MDTNLLLPGYTDQGLSYARSELCKGVDWVKSKNKYAGMALGVPVNP